VTIHDVLMIEVIVGSVGIVYATVLLVVIVILVKR
jgi:hypothetical protein